MLACWATFLDRLAFRAEEYTYKPSTVVNFYTDFLSLKSNLRGRFVKARTGRFHIPGRLSGRTHGETTYTSHDWVAVLP